MSEELSVLLQVLELYGKGVGGIWKGIKLSLKGGKKVHDYTKIKRMQHILKVHYASLGMDTSMKLDSIEKLTGGNYHIINVPTEDRDILTQLFNDLKKRKIPFAEMPDLEVGDGFVQIAIDGQDKEKVLSILSAYRSTFSSDPTEISIEEYAQMNPEQLAELAKEGYDIERRVEIVKTISNRNKNREEYTPISANYQTLILREEKDRFLFRTPVFKNQCYAFYVKKDEMVFLDEEQTVLTHIKKNEDMKVYDYDIRYHKLSKEMFSMKGELIAKHFSSVKKEVLERGEKVGLNKDKYFANFNYGEDDLEHASQKMEEEDISKSEMTIEEYAQMKPEQLAELAKEENEIERHAQIVETISNRNKNREEYIPISINVESLNISEEKDRFLFRTPVKENKSYAFYVKKDEMIFLDNGQTVITHVKGKADMEVYQYDYKSQALSKEKFSVTGEQIAGFFSPVKKEVMERSEKVGLNKDKYFANFNNGEDDLEQISQRKESKVEKNESKAEIDHPQKNGLEQTKEGNEIERHAQIVETISNRNKNREEYIPISINVESLNISEEKDRFLFRTPVIENKSYAFYVKKDEMIFLDNGQTVITHVKQKADMEVYQYDYKSQALSKEKFSVTGKQIAGFFSPVKKEVLERSEKVDLNKDKYFATLNKVDDDLEDVSQKREREVQKNRSNPGNTAKSKNKFNNFQQRNYSKSEVDAMESILLKRQYEKAENVAKAKEKTTEIKEEGLGGSEKITVDVLGYYTNSEGEQYIHYLDNGIECLSTGTIQLYYDQPEQLNDFLLTLDKVDNLPDVEKMKRDLSASMPYHNLTKYMSKKQKNDVPKSEGASLESILLHKNNRPQNPTEEVVQHIAKMEDFKAKDNSEEYFSFDIKNFKEKCVAEDENGYVIKVENQDGVAENSVRCLQISKKDSLFNEKDDVLIVNVSKDGKSKMLDIAVSDGRKKEYFNKNESLISFFETGNEVLKKVTEKISLGKKKEGIKK